MTTPPFILAMLMSSRDKGIAMDWCWENDKIMPNKDKGYSEGPVANLAPGLGNGHGYGDGYEYGYSYSHGNGYGCYGHGQGDGYNYGYGFYGYNFRSDDGRWF